MKAERVSGKFEPIEIKITLETEHEAKTFYHYFNHASINRKLDFNYKEIQDAIGTELYNSDFHNSLWDKLRKII